MMSHDLRAYVYSLLTLIGVAFAINSFLSKDYALLAISILFAGVSAYNIFCGLKK